METDFNVGLRFRKEKMLMKSTSKPHKKMSDLTYNSQASLIFFVLFCTLLCQSCNSV
jgi:hypothetical protein